MIVSEGKTAQSARVWGWNGVGGRETRNRGNVSEGFRARTQRPLVEHRTERSRENDNAAGWTSVCKSQRRRFVRKSGRK